MEDNTRAFPDLLAVDPDGCGCTECLIGEYVNESVFAFRATPADVAALMVGEIRNNTYSELFSLVLENVYYQDETEEFVKRLKTSIAKNFNYFNFTHFQQTGEID